MGSGKGREVYPGWDKRPRGITPGYPLAGLMLDAEEVVVGETVSARVMLGFYGSFPVPHHHIEDGDRAAESRQGCDE